MPKSIGTDFFGKDTCYISKSNKDFNLLFFFFAYVIILVGLKKFENILCVCYNI